MDCPPTRSDQAQDVAYLVVHRGAARVEVVPLTLGGRLTVGRAPSNRIVITDKKCSRVHCEFFSLNDSWYVRDMASRNGIAVDGVAATGDVELRFGHSVAVGDTTLLFTNTDPTTDGQDGRADRVAIIERRSGTQYDFPSGIERRGQVRLDAAELFQIGRAMHEAGDIASLCSIVLDRLMTALPAGVGAILLLPPELPAVTRNLSLVTAHSRSGDAPCAYSEYLSGLVLKEKDAVLAHDIAQHEFLSGRESIERLQADSAVCAPIRISADADAEVLGVIHLYSTDHAAPLTAEHLEFTLAVADQMAGLLVTLRERETLERNLSLEQSRGKAYRDQLEIETELVGTSPKLSRVKSAIGRVAPTDATVLIRGESGVGKELVARALHFNSHRKGGPFVCVNCAALTETLLESELFGHEKGSFTGASAQKAGKFEQADEGTIFLDEIGEMSQEIQAKFLRVLEGQSFERVGGDKEISVDVRVVTATNRNLEEAVRHGKFRSDLFFRLQVIEIDVPPLREHPEDIAELAGHFVERFTTKSRSRVKGLGRLAIEKLMKHSWPGNVRELRNVIERAVILSDREILTPDDLVLTRLDLSPLPPTPSLAATPNSSLSLETDPLTETAESDPTETCYDPQINLWGSFVQQGLTMDDIERLYMEAVLKHCDWNKSQASRILGIERTTLDRRLKRYRMSRPGGGPEDDGEETN